MDFGILTMVPTWMLVGYPRFSGCVLGLLPSLDWFLDSFTTELFFINKTFFSEKKKRKEKKPTAKSTRTKPSHIRHV
jgi:hypothetical protein